jgi:hypothetical protein
VRWTAVGVIAVSGYGKPLPVQYRGIKVLDPPLLAREDPCRSKKFLQRRAVNDTVVGVRVVGTGVVRVRMG